jgi:DNA-binding transcriptional MerR regulator
MGQERFMTQTSHFSVKELATLSGVSIRTLHYYDKIGLLPAERRSSGYRIYSQDHALRLQQILLQKSMGLSLEAIKQALDADDFDATAQLKTQRAFLVERAEDMRAMIAAVDATLAKAGEVSSEDLSALFGGFDPALYAEEAEQRWAQTDAFKTSRRRTKSYTDADWTKIKSEEATIWTDAAAAMTSGATCDSEAAGKLSERHRQHIDQWYYGISGTAYAALGDLWESDARFIANIDAYAEGLTGWFAEAARHKYLTI